MSITSFENALYRKLGTFFTSHGYQLFSEKKQFRKITSSGFQNVIFTSSTYDEETWLEVNIGCRNNRIEQIAQQFLGNTRDFWGDSNTLVISIGKFNNAKYFRYKIMTEPDLDDTCEEIKHFLSTQGFPFLEKNASLEAIHHLLNDKPLVACKYLYNQMHRCYKGMIAAKLIDSHQFLDIAEKHHKYMVSNGATDDDFVVYERLMSVLLYVSAN